MTELRNTEADASRFRTRVFVVALVVLMALCLVVARLVYLQVVRHDDLAEQAESNRTAVVPIVPNRGLIMDRNGVVLATNYSAYTLEITPSKVESLDDTIDALSKVLDIHPRDRRRFKRLMDESRNFESLPIRTRLSDEEVARFTAQRYRFPGVDIKARLFRNYPMGEVASHAIATSAASTSARKSASTSRKTRPTTAAPTISASWVWSRASRAPCTDRPAWSAWKRPPAGMRCGAWPATRPRRAIR